MPPKEVCEFVREKEHYLAEKYGTKGGLIQPPHVTIKWPFDVEDIGQFDNYCRDLSTRIQPVEIVYDGYGMFNAGVFFLKVRSTSALVCLHCKILEELKQQFGIEKNAFEGLDQQFHTTLAMEDISYEDCLAALSESKQWGFPGPFTSYRLALFKFTGEEWVVHSEYDIK